MTDLRLKYRKADLIVFASPLYIFSVTGIMKNFLDRIVPNMKPYMIIDNGETRHPHRYPEDGQQGFVVFSAAGFPEVDHNFDGLKSMFRCLHSHSEKASLMGEFFMPGADLWVNSLCPEPNSFLNLYMAKDGKELNRRVIMPESRL
ncbi:MAG: flavodoxin family protein [Deltaproteobacteria bacterium]|nr:flavodoxin family protein [Deltaproteobacteria bacterium]